MEKKFGIKSFEDFLLGSIKLGLECIGLYSIVLILVCTILNEKINLLIFGNFTAGVLVISFPSYLLQCYLIKKYKNKNTITVQDAQVLTLEIGQPLVFSIYNRSRGLSCYTLSRDLKGKLKIYSGKFQSQSEVVSIMTVTTSQNEIKKYTVKTSDGTTYEIYPIRDFDVNPEQPL